MTGHRIVDRTGPGGHRYIADSHLARAVVACLRLARKFSHDAKAASTDEEILALSRLHDEMEAEVFGITGAHFHEGDM